MKLAGAAALVTGASRGIGRATADRLAAEGARVALAARTRGDLELAVAAITARGGVAMAVRTDVTDQGQAELLVETVRERWGRVDLLVANAGAYVRRPAAELTAEAVAESLAVNLYGALYPLVAALPTMLEQRRGHIVLVSSVDGRKALPGDAPYAIAKFALTGLGQALRQELRPLGVGVSTVFPGRVDTAMTADLAVPWISHKLRPEKVAAAVVDAVRRDRAEVVVPRLASALVSVDSVSPRLGDWIVRRLRLSGWPEPRPR